MGNNNKIQPGTYDATVAMIASNLVGTAMAKRPFGPEEESTVIATAVRIARDIVYETIVANGDLEPPPQTTPDMPPPDKPTVTPATT